MTKPGRLTKRPKRLMNPGAAKPGQTLGDEGPWLLALGVACNERERETE